MRHLRDLYKKKGITPDKAFAVPYELDAAEQTSTPKKTAEKTIERLNALLVKFQATSEKWGNTDTQDPVCEQSPVVHILDKADEYNQKDEVRRAVETLYEGIARFPGEKKLYETLADLLMDGKQFEEALDVLNKMPSEKNDLRKMERTGYCKVGLECTEEAEKITELVLSIQPKSPFAWDLKGMVAYKQGDKEEAESLFKKAIDLDPGYGEPYTNLGVLKWTLDKKEEALDLLERGFILSPTLTDVVSTYHSAIIATRQFKRAERIFQETKVLYPLNRRIAFLSIDLLIQQGKNEAALSEIEEALIHFGIDDGILSAALEIRSRLGPMEVNPASEGTLSLCMIVRNEEENLPKCLMSVKSVVDEIIVVDTGSTDRTKEIAKIFGARVYDYEWADDFSGARNFSLSKAEGSWILILDADEVISSLDHGWFIKTTQEKRSQPAAYSFTTKNYVEPVNISGWTGNDGKYQEEAGTGWFPGKKVRLFPKDPRIQFEHPVHELVEPSLGKAGIRVKECPVPIHHYGKLSMNKNRKKGEEYYLLGKKKLAERENDFPAVYELAVQAGELGRYGEAVELWQKCIKLEPEDPRAHFNLGYAYIKLGNYEEARRASNRAMELAPDFKEAVFNYALCEFCVGDIWKSITVLEDLILKNSQYPSAIALLSAAYLTEGKRERGLETLCKLKSMGYDCAASLHSFAERLISVGRMDAAAALLDGAVETQNANDRILALLAECRKAGRAEPQSTLQP